MLHIIPSGICHRDKINVIGNGVLVEPVILRKEFAALELIGFEPRTNLYISRKAHLILPTHRLLDAANEASKAERKIGSTLKGIGPAYTDKVARVGVRVGDIARSDFKAVYEKAKESHLNLIRSLGYDVDAFRVEDKTLSEYERQWFEALDFLKGLKVIDSEYYLNEALDKGLKILAEGAQGSMLDIDFGSYPFVTSSNTITAGVCSGLGIAPSRVGKVFGICKAYCTRVGSGPFPTELFDADGEELRQKGREFGSTTGRPRRCGWLDIPALRYACMLNGVTHLMLMKIDVMNGFSRIKVCDSYEINGKRTMNVPYDMEERISPLYSDYDGWLQDVGGVGDYEALPQRMKDYIAMIEQKTGLPVALVSTSPDRKDTIIRTEL